MKKLLIMSIALLFGVTIGFAQTPAKNVNKILKKGFIPKSTNNKFE